MESSVKKFSTKILYIVKTKHSTKREKKTFHIIVWQIVNNLPSGKLKRTSYLHKTKKENNSNHSVVSMRTTTSKKVLIESSKTLFFNLKVKLLQFWNTAYAQYFKNIITNIQLHVVCNSLFLQYNYWCSHFSVSISTDFHSYDKKTRLHQI